jgi:hypothetical protein
MRHKLRHWGMGPALIIPRWVLFVMYLGFAVFGAATTVTSIPTIELTAFDGYATFFSLALFLSATLAAVFSTRGEWETAEKWSAIGVASVLTAYVGGLVVLALGGDTARVGSAIAFAMLNGIPMVRVVHLIMRSGGRVG